MKRSEHDPIAVVTLRDDATFEQACIIRDRLTNNFDVEPRPSTGELLIYSLGELPTDGDEWDGTLEQEDR